MTAQRRLLDPWQTPAGKAKALRFDIACDRLERITWSDYQATYTAVEPTAIAPGVYRCERAGRQPLYLEVHHNRPPVLTLLWVHEDGGIAVACARSRGGIDAINPRQEARA